MLGALWTYGTDHRAQLFFDSYQHVSAVVQSVLLATVIGVAVGVLTYRNRLAAELATATSSVILTVPAFALLGQLIPCSDSASSPASLRWFCTHCCRSSGTPSSG